jgi:hypothetical protein
MKSVARKVKPYVAGGGWSHAAKEGQDRMIQGQLVVFVDGKYLCGPEHKPMAPGVQLTALDTTALWVFWQNGKPVEDKSIVRQADGELPARETLGHLDQSKWEKGPDGAPRDPFANTRLVLLIDRKTAELFTFSTKSEGGRVAVSELAKRIELMRETYPGACAIVTLSDAQWSIKYMKTRPQFRITGWEMGDDGAEGAQPALVRRLTLQDEQAAALKGDGIPFA